MNSDCLLCRYHEDCQDDILVLYAAAPILQQIVTSKLDKLGARYQRKDRLFTIEAEHESVIQGLRSQLSEAERADIRVSKQRGPGLLASSTLQEYGAKIDTAWFDAALRDDKFTIFFQPIVDTSKSIVFAHECLIRLFADRPYNGGEIIEAALSRGSIHTFDSYARRLSIRRAGIQVAAGTKVFVNFMPSSIYNPVFCMASTLEEMSKTGLKPADIVFEVVESDKIRDVSHLQRICDYYRDSGFGFALDDVGTGSNSLQMVCDLKPDYAKLDKSLISNIRQPMYLAAVQKLTEFADQFNVQVIAEGVEDSETMARLQKLNIHLMQGYFFGKPAPQMNSIARDLTQIGNQLHESVAPQRVTLRAS